MSKTSFISQDNPQALRNPWVLGWLGLLAFVVLVNVVFITVSFKTSPGLVDPDYYEKGRDHEQNMQKKMAARAALGWNTSFRFGADPVMGQESLLVVTAKDRDNQPIERANVEIRAYRPSDSAADFQVATTEAGDGQYHAFLNFPLKGIWELDFVVSKGEDRLSSNHRLIVRAPDAQ